MKYHYGCTIDRVIDGDTIDVTIDLGFTITMKKRVRLFGVNAPERFEDAGKEATAYVKSWVRQAIESNCRFSIRTIKDDEGKYGRLLGIFYRDPIGIFATNIEKNVSLNEMMVINGHAEWRWITDEQKFEYFKIIN